MSWVCVLRRIPSVFDADGGVGRLRCWWLVVASFAAVTVCVICSDECGRRPDPPRLR